MTEFDKKYCRANDVIVHMLLLWVASFGNAPLRLDATWKGQSEKTYNFGQPKNGDIRSRALSTKKIGKLNDLLLGYYEADSNLGFSLL